MVLVLTKKSLVRDSIQFYANSADGSYESFLSGILKEKATPDFKVETYDEWLIQKIVGVLSKNGVSIDDCIENKDVLRSAIDSDKSRNDGEFYTPEVWCSEGRNVLKKVMKDSWGSANVWEASCGTGNLMKTSGYPQDKLFMSSLLQEDIDCVSAIYPDATCFQLDFLNGMDYDEYNTLFSDKLPDNLRSILENDEPLCFYMNPPYKVGKTNITDIGSVMNMEGLGKCGLDLFHQFLYRILALKRFYKLTKLTLGIFGPITFMHSSMIKELFDQFKGEFDFADGMFFNAGDFSGTSDSVGWAIGFTVWTSKGVSASSPKAIKLQVKKLNTAGEIVSDGFRLISDVEENLHTWASPSDTFELCEKPSITSMFKVTGSYGKMAVNSLGQLMSSNYVIRGTRRCAVTVLPCVDGIDITEENYWRCVASFSSRRCYAYKPDVFANCQYLSKPMVDEVGYDAWLKDALALFLFEYSNNTASYINFPTIGGNITQANPFFPVARDALLEASTSIGLKISPRVEQHFNSTRPANAFTMAQLLAVYDDMTPEATALLTFGTQKILESLDIGVKDYRLESFTKGESNESIFAWDASLGQIRGMSDFWTADVEKEFRNLLMALKAKLYQGVFTFGILMQTGGNENGI